MKRYSLNSIVGGRYNATILKQLIKPLIDVKSLGKRQGGRLPKLYTLEELKIIKEMLAKRREKIQIGYYVETEEAHIFFKLVTFIKETEENDYGQ